MTGPRPSDRWIPWYFVAFFVVLTAVLGIFSWLAVRSYTGEITKNAYQKGLAYNHALEETKNQSDLGWVSDLSITPNSNGLSMVFHLSNASGAAIANAQVEAWLIRPTQDGFDQHIELQPSHGAYKGEATLPLRGQWAVHISATHDGNNYQQMKTIVLP